MTDLLVERARRGDPDAFVALIEERQVAMARVATAILGNEADVADALQETLVAMWRELPRLRSVERFPAWADTILVNACRLVLRRRCQGARSTGPAERRSDMDRTLGSDRPEAWTPRLPIATRSTRAFEVLVGGRAGDPRPPPPRGPPRRARSQKRFASPPGP